MQHYEVNSGNLFCSSACSRTLCEMPFPLNSPLAHFIMMLTTSRSLERDFEKKGIIHTYEHSYSKGDNLWLHKKFLTTKEIFKKLCQWNWNLSILFVLVRMPMHIASLFFCWPQAWCHKFNLIMHLYFN